MTQQLERTMVRTSVCLTYLIFYHLNVKYSNLSILVISDVVFICDVLCGVILDLTGQDHQS